MKETLRHLFKKALLPLFSLMPLIPVRGEDSALSVRITTEEAEAMYSTFAMQRVSVHDPSIVYDETSGNYYVFGSHIATARTDNLQDWTWVTLPWGTIDDDGAVVSGVSSAEAFCVNQTKEITVRGERVAFGNYNAADWNCAIPGTDANGEAVDWTVDGNMWAPDVIYNPAMKKWCQYLSLNGPEWNSCIILLTADRIEGPYVYQGPVVYTGFRNDTDERISYHKTDLEMALGEQEHLPARYNKENWGDFWPHAIDPCVFYDEDSLLWMSYGSWSGGIYMLRLDETTGLRDYDVEYGSDFDSRQQDVTTDPYFGKKIAGGWYVSGEGSYIERIGNYYYLFMSYGGLEPNGGYEMRVFRSERPDGPYKDMNGTDAIFSSGWRLNFGLNADNRGARLMGAYNGWGLMTVGECAQGHNSVLAAADGNTYLVYHTKFNDGTAGHQVRVHQLYLNEEGWLVAAPFEYNGETVGDSQISSARIFSTADVAGQYKVLLHRYNLDHANMEEVTPVDVTLNADGTATGAYAGSWEVYDHNSYVTLTLDGITYHGVVVEQQMEPTTMKAICFTACGSNGVALWGYRMEDRYALAYTVNASDFPVRDGLKINQNVDLYGMTLEEPVRAEWTSDRPDVLSSTGRYNPAGLTEDVDVCLAVRLSAGYYYWTEEYNVTAMAEQLPDGDWQTAMRAYYGFDEEPFVNAYDESQEALLLSQGGTLRPSLEQDSLRMGNVLHQYFGAIGFCSYTQMPNPLLGDDPLDGMTISLWVKRADDVLWDAIWSFYNPSANIRLYMTGNSYIGFNDGLGNWFDINYPNTMVPDNIPVGEWCLVTLVLSREQGCILYVNGRRVRNMAYAGECEGQAVASADDFDYDLVMDFIESCPDFYLGYGSFWGSVDVRLDDLIIYSRALTSKDVNALNKMSNRVTDFTNVDTGGSGSFIQGVKEEVEERGDGSIYDLSGRRVQQMKKGVYIVNGKKVICR